MKTRITSLLGIEFPIFQGAMAWISEAELSAAVSNAGGAGIIAAGGRDANWLKSEIIKCRALTHKPFGVNVQLMAQNKDEIIGVICDERPAFVTLGAGNPIPYISTLKAKGIKVIPVVPSVKLAKRVEANGADAIIIEGMEAGGHIGLLTTMSLLTQVIPEVNIPVVIAGGIADGRGLAASLIMGASGVQIGTRFLVAHECQVHPKYKAKIIAATDVDTVITGWTTNHRVRGIKNQFTDKFIEMELSCVDHVELEKISSGTSRKAAIDGDVDYGMVHAGQSILHIQKEEPAHKIINDIITEAKSTLSGAKDLLVNAKV